MFCNLILIITLLGCFSTVFSYSKGESKFSELKAALLKSNILLDDGLVNLWPNNWNLKQKLPQPYDVTEVETKYFEQKLDHFNPDDDRTFEMVRSKKFVGPAFVYNFRLFSIFQLLTNLD